MNNEVASDDRTSALMFASFYPIYTLEKGDKGLDSSRETVNCLVNVNKH